MWSVEWKYPLAGKPECWMLYDSFFFRRNAVKACAVKAVDARSVREWRVVKEATRKRDGYVVLEMCKPTKDIP